MKMQLYITDAVDLKKHEIKISLYIFQEWVSNAIFFLTTYTSLHSLISGNNFYVR